MERAIFSAPWVQVSNYISHFCDSALRGCWVEVEWPQPRLLPLSRARGQKWKKGNLANSTICSYHFFLFHCFHLSAKEKGHSFFPSSCTNGRGLTADVNSTCLTLSSSLLSIGHNLSPQRPTLTHFVWMRTTQFFLIDQKAIAVALNCLLDSRGSISECRTVRLWGLGILGEGQVSSTMWGEFLSIWWEQDTEVCSLGICLQLVHIFQSRWFQILGGFIWVVLV